MIVTKQTYSRPDLIERQRTQGRLNSRIPISVEWTKGEQSFRKDGHTIDISPAGCLAVITRGLAVGSRLRLINLSNKNSCEAVVVWIRSKGRHNWCLGLELYEPGPDFWGIDL